MSAAFDAAVIRKAISTARLLESDMPEEAVAAALALKRLGRGASFADVLEEAFAPWLVASAVAPSVRPIWDIRTDPLCPWRNTARMMLVGKDQFNERELQFLEDMVARRERPTGPQQQWLDDLAARFSRRAA